MTELKGTETLREFRERKNIKKIADYFIYHAPEHLEPLLDTPVAKLYTELESKSLMNGLNRLLQIADAGEYYYPIYPEEECVEDSQKKDVNILHFPSLCEEKKDKPYILVCAGGAYFNVWSLTEAYPVAARFNELGYEAFTMTYRTSGENLFPKPFDDVAAAIRYIDAHAEEFGVNAGKYIVCGFSAGGNLTLQWGTKQNGYAAYDLPKPQALFPVYPVVSFKDYLYDELFKEMADVTMGKDCSEDVLLKYDIVTNIDSDYPPCYFPVCEDDELVPPSNSVMLKKKLIEVNVPSVMEMKPRGGHGFGEGLHCDCSGWVQRAIEFYENL